jgi:hypothetical protein
MPRLSNIPMDSFRSTDMHVLYRYLHPACLDSEADMAASGGRTFSPPSAGRSPRYQGLDEEVFEGGAANLTPNAHLAYAPFILEKA